MTNKDLRRRETDKFGPYVQQVALDHANKRIAELEKEQGQLMKELAVAKNPLHWYRNYINLEQERDQLRQRIECVEKSSSKDAYAKYLSNFNGLDIEIDEDVFRDAFNICKKLYALPPAADKKGE